ncbi:MULTISPECIES: GNAT family protein [unclassified Arthrobacter]|uniref:GNAT family N-acetyltransferase n=1 Tax=unclassified Arthrobacter TaxID=235627 RepID=UPI001CFF992D|nr:MULTISPECIES: GNAT family protein [unclassified Arthrobacter]WGZ80872.1 GNAT family protein [Arthrobacter sp. EM1]
MPFPSLAYGQIHGRRTSSGTIGTLTVELRPWTLEDAPALRAAYQQNPDLKTQFGSAHPATIDQARDYIGAQLPFTESRRNWAITIDGAAVGNVGLSAIDRRHETAWMYYWLTSAARGRGYTVRALATIAAAAFEDGLFRLELGHRVNNPASCKVASSAGFIPEGIERQKLAYGAERFDVETHARLRTDSCPHLTMLPLSR